MITAVVAGIALTETRADGTRRHGVRICSAMGAWCRAHRVLVLASFADAAARVVAGVSRGTHARGHTGSGGGQSGRKCSACAAQIAASRCLVLADLTWGTSIMVSVIASVADTVGNFLAFIRGRRRKTSARGAQLAAHFRFVFTDVTRNTSRTILFISSDTQALSQLDCACLSRRHP